MDFCNIIDRCRLVFQDDKELRQSLFNILGVYPHDLSLYRQALLHKSVGRRNDKGRPLNNERLEFLGDAVLDAVVGHIVYSHFPGKREGFLTNTRSKLVSRETLGRLSKEMGIAQLITSSGGQHSHNSYMNGNAFEALVGSLYLDRGYQACMKFVERRILSQLINIDKVAYKEVNFKSKLLEWSQKNRVKLEFVEQKVEKEQKTGSPKFTSIVTLEGVEGCQGTGFSKKESQQQAAKETLQRLRREPQFIDSVFAAKADRTKMEEEPVMAAPDIDKLEREQKDFFDTPDAGRSSGDTDSKRAEKSSAGKGVPSAAVSDDFSFEDIRTSADEPSREDIIAAAEAAAFAEGE